MRILLLGKTGQVGFELHRALAPMGEIIAPGRSDLDLMNEKAVTNYLINTQPSLVVNAAAWTAVDAAETQMIEAKRLNSGLPQQLAQYAADNDIRLVHYSTDYVYPGDGIQSWEETSATGPLNYYGSTKLQGDLEIAKHCTNYLIFRTSWVYSARGNNFMKTMLRLAQSKAEIKVVSDQIGGPTPARLIAQITALALFKETPSGIYNLAAKDEASWYDFTLEILNLAKALGEKHILSVDRVEAIPTNDYPTPARRPLNSRLDVGKLEKALGISFPDWKSQLALTLNEYLEKR